MSLTAEQIKTRPKKPPLLVEIPEWSDNGQPGQVYVREISARERDQFEATMVDSAGPDKLANVRARFVAIVACDEKGSRLFSDDDATWLGDCSAAALDRIFDAGRQFNGMLAQAEDAKKNSATIPAGPSA